MRHTLLIPAIMAAALAGGGVRQHAAEGGFHHEHEMAMGALDQIDLTDAQWLSIHKIMQAQRGAHHREGHEGMHRMLATVNPDSPDFASQVQAAQDQAAAAAREHVAHAAAVKQQIWAVLTPDQKTKLATMAGKHHGHHAE